MLNIVIIVVNKNAESFIFKHENSLYPPDKTSHGFPLIKLKITTVKLGRR